MIRAFLVGGLGGGGEEVFVRHLAASPPPEVEYDLVLGHHESAGSARARTLVEILFNRLVHPFLWPLPGLRAYDVAPHVDLVHVHNFASLLHVPPGCPVVYSVGGSTYIQYMEEYLGWTRERVRARYARARRIYRPLRIRSEIATPEFVDAVAVFSDHAAGYLSDLGVPEEKIHIVPPGFDIPAPATSRSGRPFTFLLVGRQPERKGADVALAAFRELKGAGSEARMVLVGDPAYPAMATGPGEVGVGPVDQERLFRDFYGGADVVLVPSRAEGFGFAAVEGMAHGVPVIASRRDALPSIVGDTGVLVAPGDVRELREAMSALVEDPERARGLGRAARRRFEATYELGKAREALSSLYRTVLGSA